jgi:hypothetical protein
LFAFSAGPVILKPSFTFTTGYNDNIYSLPSDSPLEDFGLIESRDDFTFILSPGLSARLGREDSPGWVELTYQFDQMLYVANTDSDSPNHSFGLGMAVSGSRLSYSNNNSWDVLSSIMTGYEATIEGVVVPPGNVDRQNLNTSHTLNYDLTHKSRLTAGGNWTYLDYAGEGLNAARFADTSSWNLNAGYNYALAEQFRLGASFGYGQQKYSGRETALPGLETPDWSINSYTISATGSGNFTARLSGNIRVGYQHRDLYGGDANATIGLEHQLGERTSLALDYSRSGGLASTSGLGTVTDAGSFSVSQTVGNRRPWGLSARVRYARSEYVDSGDTLGSLTVSCGASRPLTRWASAFLNYSYEIAERASYDYAVNQVNLGVRLGL